MTWNWLRLVTAVAGAASAVCSFIFPPAAAVLLPLGTGLIGLSLHPPGATPLASTEQPTPPPVKR